MSAKTTAPAFTAEDIATLAHVKATRPGDYALVLNTIRNQNDAAAQEANETAAQTTTAETAAKTTTARKSRTFRPEILDASERINALSSITANDPFRQLLQSAERIVSTVSVLGTKDARKVWESKEEAFLSVHGMAWGEALALQEDIEANPEDYAGHAATVKETPAELDRKARESQMKAQREAYEEFKKSPEFAKYNPGAATAQAAPATLPGLTAKDIEGLRKVYNENPNATIPRPIWGKVFSGACASRRAGIDFRTWATRTTAIPRPVVADIAFRVWSLPESELLKNAPVRAAF